jgi:RNA polymerase sigma factor (sigma-70 family)
MRTNPPRISNRRRTRLLRKLQLLEPTSSHTTIANPLDAAGRSRAEAYCPLAYQLAWRFARRYARDMPVDELIAEALYALTYAAGIFDEKREVPFGAYANMVIKHRLIQAILSWRRARRVGPMPLLFDGEGEWEAESRPGPDVPTTTATQEMCDRVRRALPARWFAVLHLYHGEGRTLEEIGDHLGVSRQRVQQLVIKARERVQRCFPEWTKF